MGIRGTITTAKNISLQYDLFALALSALNTHILRLSHANSTSVPSPHTINVAFPQSTPIYFLTRYFQSFLHQFLQLPTALIDANNLNYYFLNTYKSYLTSTTNYLQYDSTALCTIIEAFFNSLNSIHLNFSITSSNNITTSHSLPLFKLIVCFDGLPSLLKGSTHLNREYSKVTEAPRFLSHFPPLNAIKALWEDVLMRYAGDAKNRLECTLRNASTNESLLFTQEHSANAQPRVFQRLSRLNPIYNAFLHEYAENQVTLLSTPHSISSPNHTATPTATATTSDQTPPPISSTPAPSSQTKLATYQPNPNSPPIPLAARSILQQICLDHAMDLNSNTTIIQSDSENDPQVAYLARLHNANYIIAQDGDYFYFGDFVEYVSSETELTSEEGSEIDFSLERSQSSPKSTLHLQDARQTNSIQSPQHFLQSIHDKSEQNSPFDSNSINKGILNTPFQPYGAAPQTTASNNNKNNKPNQHVKQGANDKQSAQTDANSSQNPETRAKKINYKGLKVKYDPVILFPDTIKIDFFSNNNHNLPQQHENAPNSQSDIASPTQQPHRCLKCDPQLHQINHIFTSRANSFTFHFQHPTSHVSPTPTATTLQLTSISIKQPHSRHSSNLAAAFSSSHHHIISAGCSLHSYYKACYPLYKYPVPHCHLQYIAFLQGNDFNAEPIPFHRLTKSHHVIPILQYFAISSPHRSKTQKCLISDTFRKSYEKVAGKPHHLNELHFNVLGMLMEHIVESNGNGVLMLQMMLKKFLVGFLSNSQKVVTTASEISPQLLDQLQFELPFHPCQDSKLVSLQAESKKFFLSTFAQLFKHMHLLKQDEPGSMTDIGKLKFSQLGEIFFERTQSARAEVRKQRSALTAPAEQNNTQIANLGETIESLSLSLPPSNHPLSLNPAPLSISNAWTEPQSISAKDSRKNATQIKKAHQPINPSKPRAINKSNTSKNMSSTQVTSQEGPDAMQKNLLKSHFPALQRLKTLAALLNMLFFHRLDDSMEIPHINQLSDQVFGKSTNKKLTKHQSDQLRELQSSPLSTTVLTFSLPATTCPSNNNPLSITSTSTLTTLISALTTAKFSNNEGKTNVHTDNPRLCHEINNIGNSSGPSLLPILSNLLLQLHQHHYAQQFINNPNNYLSAFPKEVKNLILFRFSQFLQSPYGTDRWNPVRQTNLHRSHNIADNHSHPRPPSVTPAYHVSPGQISAVHPLLRFRLAHSASSLDCELQHNQQHNQYLQTPPIPSISKHHPLHLKSHPSTNHPPNVESKYRIYPSTFSTLFKNHQIADVLRTLHPQHTLLGWDNEVSPAHLRHTIELQIEQSHSHAHTISPSFPTSTPLSPCDSKPFPDTTSETSNTTSDNTGNNFNTNYTTILPPNRPLELPYLSISNNNILDIPNYHTKTMSRSCNNNLSNSPSFIATTKRCYLELPEQYYSSFSLQQLSDVTFNVAVVGQERGMEAAYLPSILFVELKKPLLLPTTLVRRLLKLAEILATCVIPSTPDRIIHHFGAITMCDNVDIFDMNSADQSAPTFTPCGALFLRLFYDTTTQLTILLESVIGDIGSRSHDPVCSFDQLSSLYPTLENAPAALLTATLTSLCQNIHLLITAALHIPDSSKQSLVATFTQLFQDLSQIGQTTIVALFDGEFQCLADSQYLSSITDTNYSNPRPQIHQTLFHAITSCIDSPPSSPLPLNLALSWTPYLLALVQLKFQYHHTNLFTSSFRRYFSTESANQSFRTFFGQSSSPLPANSAAQSGIELQTNSISDSHFQTIIATFLFLPLLAYTVMSPTNASPCFFHNDHSSQLLSYETISPALFTSLDHHLTHLAISSHSTSPLSDESILRNLCAAHLHLLYMRDLLIAQYQTICETDALFGICFPVHLRLPQLLGDTLLLLRCYHVVSKFSLHESSSSFQSILLSESADEVSFPSTTGLERQTPELTVLFTSVLFQFNTLLPLVSLPACQNRIDDVTFDCEECGQQKDDHSTHPQTNLPTDLVMLQTALSYQRELELNYSANFPQSTSISPTILSTIKTRLNFPTLTLSSLIKTAHGAKHPDLQFDLELGSQSGIGDTNPTSISTSRGRFPNHPATANYDHMIVPTDDFVLARTLTSTIAPCKVQTDILPPSPQLDLFPISFSTCSRSVNRAVDNTFGGDCLEPLQPQLNATTIEYATMDALPPQTDSTEAKERHLNHILTDTTGAFASIVQSTIENDTIINAMIRNDPINHHAQHANDPSIFRQWFDFQSTSIATRCNSCYTPTIHSNVVDLLHLLNNGTNPK